LSYCCGPRDRRTPAKSAFSYETCCILQPTRRLARLLRIARLRLAEPVDQRVWSSDVFLVACLYATLESNSVVVELMFWWLADVLGYNVARFVPLVSLGRIRVASFGRYEREFGWSGGRRDGLGRILSGATVSILKIPTAKVLEPLLRPRATRERSAAGIGKSTSSASSWYRCARRAHHSDGLYPLAGLYVLSVVYQHVGCCDISSWQMRYEARRASSEQ